MSRKSDMYDKYGDIIPDGYFGLENDMWFEASPSTRKYWKEQKQKKEEPITLTDEQITEMWESGYISDKEEYKDGND